MRGARYLLLAMFLGACSEPMAGSLRTGPNPAAVEATRKLNLGNLQDVGETFFGDVIIRSLGGRDIAVALDGGTSAGQADGFVDQVFVLQRSDSGAVIERRITGARVLYRKRGMIISDARGPALGFFLADADAEAIRRESGTGASTPALAQSWRGYGLSRRTLVQPVEFARWDAASMAATLPCAASSDGEVTAFDAGKCDSGGPGSAGCTTSCPMGGSCSVSCTSGFNSCCNSGLCNCTCLAVDHEITPPPS